MSYTVNKLSKISGVSVRALRFYDEIGLLRPAYVGDNGYRYYEEEQLLMLQQILFFRELGFPLGEIQKLIGSADFDKIETLKSHREVLRKSIQRSRELVETIDKSIAKLKGTGTMKDDEMYLGFDKAKQEAYERELVEKYGDKAQAGIDESKRRMKGWKKDDYARVGKEGEATLRSLVTQMESGASPDDPEVQKLIRLHYQWVCNFWTPDKTAYEGLGRLYVEHPDFRKYFEPFHPKLVEFLADAMKEFAHREL